MVQVVINSNAPYQKAQRNPGLLLIACSVLPGKHPDPSARGRQGAEAMTCLELDLHYNSRMSNICGHVQVHENLYLWRDFHYVIGCKWFLNICFEWFFFPPFCIKMSSIFYFRHQAMATGGPGGLGASVLAHVGEEYSLPTGTAIIPHPETAAATARGRGPSTAPAMSCPAHLTVRCSQVSATTMCHV